MADEIREPGKPQPSSDGRNQNVQKADSGKYDWEHEDGSELERRERRRRARKPGANTVPGSLSWFRGLWCSLAAALSGNNVNGFDRDDDDDPSPSAA